MSHPASLPFLRAEKGHSRVGGGWDPHYQKVVLLPKQPPQAPVVATHIQVPDMEALWGGVGRGMGQRAVAGGPLRTQGPAPLPPQQPLQSARDGIFFFLFTISQINFFLKVLLIRGSSY